MHVFIDKDYKCHTFNGGGMREIDTAFFDSKCDAFIGGYRFVPAGETWVREDGVEFPGEMISPWKPYDELEKAQAQWEHEQLALITEERESLLDTIQILVDQILTEGASDV